MELFVVHVRWGLLLLLFYRCSCCRLLLLLVLIYSQSLRGVVCLPCGIATLSSSINLLLLLLLLLLLGDYPYSKLFYLVPFRVFTSKVNTYQLISL